MRAGSFAETRVIDLVNRRFVAFYFNRSGRGAGGDEAALKFIADRTRNPYASFAAFAPTGELLAETALYADKDETFEFLLDLLRRHPEYAAATPEECATLAAVDSNQASSAECLAAARVWEELGAWKSSDRCYERVAQLAPKSESCMRALIGRARVARYRGDWESASQWCDLAAVAAWGGGLDAGAELAVERGHASIAMARYDEARCELETAIQRFPTSPRLGELHYYAGIACYFAGATEWAKYHWCWVCENIPEDRLFQRCRFTATFERNPYPNPEIQRFDYDLRINPDERYDPDTTELAYAEACAVYWKLAR